MKLILLFFFTSFFAHGQELNDSLPLDPNTITGQLPNGMKYYIRKNSKPEKRAELRLAVNAGSTSENDDQQGLAHFTEHMAFNGTENFKKSELVDYLESVGTKFGPHLNAYTSFDETVYMLQIPTDKLEILDKGLTILENWSHRLSFDSVEVQKERGVVVEEWRIGQGAEERMRRIYWPVLFKDSRYGVRLPIGKKDIIENASLKTIKDFYNDWYRPELMAVIAVGDFDPIEMEKKIKEIFSSVPAKKTKRPVIAYQVPDNAGLLISTVKDKEARLGRVQLIYKQPFEKQSTVADYRRSLAHELFTSMLNSRLNELVRQPQPPFIFAGTSFGKLVRNRYIYSCVAGAKEDAIDSALAKLIQENERVRRFGFTESEFNRAKDELVRGYEQSFNEKDKTESRDFAREYVSNFLTAEPMPGIEFEYGLAKKFISGIALEDVNAFAKQWITNGKNAVVIITAPDKPTTKIPTEASIEAVMKNMNSLVLEQFNDKIADGPLVTAKLDGSPVVLTKQNSFDIQEWNLKNGIKIFAKATDFKNDQLLFSSYSWGGWSLYPEKEYLTAVYADEILDESGFGNFTATQLEKKLSGKVVSCSPYISELMQGFNGSCSTKDLQTLFELIYGYATNPRKDADAFNSFIDRQKSVLKNRYSDPESVFMDTVAYIMSGYNERFKPKTESMFDQISLDRAFDIYKERFKDHNGSVYVFVGNFNIDTLKALTAKYLGSLPAAGSRPNWQDIGVEAPKGKVIKTVVKGEAPKSVVLLRWNMPFEYNRLNRNEMNALNKLVSIRLREVLREDKSGVYGVSFNSSPQHFPNQKLEQSVYFSCNPANVESLIEAAMGVLKEVRTKGCDEKNLLKIKETFIRERETYMRENQFWLNVIMYSFQNGEEVDDLKNYNAWVESLKTTDFLAFATKYLQDTNFAKFILVPEQK